MIQWLLQFKNATRETKWFILNWGIYGLILILTTVYVYARMDFVRSYETKTLEKNK